MAPFGLVLAILCTVCIAPAFGNDILSVATDAIRSFSTGDTVSTASKAVETFVKGLAGPTIACGGNFPHVSIELSGTNSILARMVKSPRPAIIALPGYTLDCEKPAYQVGECPLSDGAFDVTCTVVDVLKRSATCSYKVAGVPAYDAHVLQWLAAEWPEEYSQFLSNNFDSRATTAGLEPLPIHTRIPEELVPWAALLLALAGVVAVYMSLPAQRSTAKQTAHISEDERQILETRVRELDAELQCVRHRLQDADALLAQERAQRIMLETHLAAEAAALEAERALASSMQRELDEMRAALAQLYADAHAASAAQSASSAVIADAEAQAHLAREQGRVAELEVLVKEHEARSTDLDRQVRRLKRELAGMHEKYDECAYEAGLEDEMGEHFEFVRLLSSGAFGKVMLARHRESGEQVAIKTAFAHVMRDEREDRWATELHVVQALVQGDLAHPAIATFHGFFEYERRLHFVMAVYACDVADVIGTYYEDHGAGMPEAAARHFGGQMLAGILHLHANGIVHRDIKPANLMVSAEGSLKIIDFGTARDDAQFNPRSSTFTGTINYCAPEMFEAEYSLAGVDLWAAGTTLYEMLTGDEAFAVCYWASHQGRWVSPAKERTGHIADHSCAMQGTNHACVKAAIEEGRLTFRDESGISDESKAAVRSLCTADPASRLGARGLEEVCAHPFFAPLDWAVLDNEDVPAPGWESMKEKVLRAVE